MALPTLRFSVVVPAYNRGALLPFTLDAILAQTITPLEVIVVDDGSQDDTAAVLAAYGPLVRTIRIPNSGDLAARNVGLRAARGDIVAFCDSDDVWTPAFLSAMAELWAAEPSLIAASSDFCVVRDGQWEPEGKFASAPAGFWDALRPVAPDLGVFDAPVIDRLLYFQPFFPSCLAAHRETFLCIGGWDEGVSRIVGCDFATILRLVEHGSFGVIDRKLVGIRRHAGNFSADVQAMNLGDSHVLEHVLETRPALARHEIEIRASIADRRRGALNTAFARGDLASVRSIGALLRRTEHSTGTRVKALVAALPEPIAPAAAGVLRAIGSVRAGIRGAI